MITASPLVLKSLVATLQRDLTPKTVYPVVDTIERLLTEVYAAVFQGPLPPVDGSALTNLTADNLIGTLPAGLGVAYLDDLNLFTRGQSIIWNDPDEPFLEVGFGDSFTTTDPTSYFRILSIADGEFHISQNAFYDSSGPSWGQDNAAIDSFIIDFVDGTLGFRWWDNAAGAYKKTFLFDGPDSYIRNAADTAYLYLTLRDANNVIHLGESAAVDNTGLGYVTIPAKANASLPSANANHAGIIAIDTTNNRLCFWRGALRYYINGTSF